MIPLLNTPINAGFPSPANDYIESELDFNTYLIKNRSATYALKVQGDSMINAGIFPGDILIVDRSMTPKSNDIIIASIDKEFTVKRFIKNSKGFFLYPENQDYPIIELNREEDFTMWGVVTYTIHNFFRQGGSYDSTNRL
ncbi:MAG: translesion error-prone DNA polymerase V autoproteolytic subunit [Spirochaetaceae bacterium]